LNHHTQNIASHWFRASEQTGDFMGIRYGRLPQGSDEVEWSFVSHCDCDGIGGFARILREQGAELLDLPQAKMHCRAVVAQLWKLWRGSHQNQERANRSDWQQPASLNPRASSMVGWHLFTEDETQNIRNTCRQSNVTVNSLLLKHLDQAIRPETRRPHLTIPWMIPVNLRGDINHADDTENHVSCVEVSIASEDSVGTIHKKILRRLEHGEHHANHLLLGLGKFLSHQSKVKFLTKDRSKLTGNIGAFSNLGVWDSDRKISTNDSWLFCPPVVKGQLLAAGCLTFQNRLGLAIQPHPGLSSSPNIATNWMNRWIKRIWSQPENFSD